MHRRVKGILFADYVRMLRAHKEADWSTRLNEQDLHWLSQRIDRDGWYPMEAFERLGLVILNVLVDGDLEQVRQFGRASVEWLSLANPGLQAASEPREIVMRFHEIRQSYFDFAPIELIALTDQTLALQIDYRMGDVAEEAASLQTMGFFEALLERGGARDVSARFASSRWMGEGRTLLELEWVNA